MKVGFRAFYWKMKEYLSDMEKKPFSILPSRDGKLYELRESSFGKIFLEKRDVRELDDIREGFIYTLPKIPGEIMEVILSFFRSYSKSEEQYEVMLQIFWDTQEKDYLIHCPNQFVTKFSIHAERDHRIETSGRFVQVCQFHSHNIMPAFFSETDNRDEVEYLIYGVVGRLINPVPDILLRVGYGGRFIDLPIECIFEPFNPMITRGFPHQWLDCITVVKE